MINIEITKIVKTIEELLPIQTEGKVPVVNARDLHEYLEVKSKFADWIKNSVRDYDFIEDEDFTTLSKNLEKGGRTKEYGLSMDMGKELCMFKS